MRRIISSCRMRNLNQFISVLDDNTMKTQIVFLALFLFSVNPLLMAFPDYESSGNAYAKRPFDSRIQYRRKLRSGGGADYHALPHPSHPSPRRRLERPSQRRPRRHPEKDEI